MKTIGKIFILLSATVLIAWLGPWIYALATAKPYRSPFTLYSCVLRDFTSAVYGGKDIKFEDRSGQTHDESVQPMFYYHDLAMHGMAPDSILGRKIVPEEVERNRIILTSEPGRIAKKAAPVYIIMESVATRSELDEPEEAFVVRKDGIYIYNMNANEEVSDKTKEFNEALSSLGFSHPAVLVSGNPSTRKEYDEGYLMTDSKGDLFHIRQDEGKPFVEKFDAASGLSLKHIIITEFSNHKTLGMLIDKDNRLHMLSPQGEITPTEVSFDPYHHDFLVVGDMFFYTIKVSDRSGETFYALNSDDFSFVDTMRREYPTDEFNYSTLVFPVRITFTSSNDEYVKPRFGKFSWWAILVNAVIAYAWVVLRRRTVKEALTEVPFILFGGPIALIPIALL